MTSYSGAIWAPGPPSKVNGGINSIIGVVCHSMVGTYAGARSRLDDTTTLRGRASWHYSVLQDGRVMSHYIDEAQCWHAGSGYNNTTIGIEHEGGYDPEDEPLTPAQLEASVALVHWLADHHGFALVRGAGLWEHNEVSGAPTACPSHRIPWDAYMEPATAPANEDEDEMKPQVVAADDGKVYLVGFAAPIWLTSNDEVAALEKLYGPRIKVQAATVAQMKTSA